MDRYTDDQTTFDYSYSVRGGGSINHPSVDRLTDYSLMSDKGHHHSNYSSRNNTRSKSTKQITQQRQRASSHPTADVLYGIGSTSSAAVPSRSFVSEPTTRLRPATTGNSSFQSSLSPKSSSFFNSTTSTASKSFADQVLSDRPSETRLRIERSLSNIREQQARSASRISRSSSSSSSSNKRRDLGYQEHNSMANDRHHHRQQRTRSSRDDAAAAIDQRELAVKYHAWETDFQQRTVDAIDERYKQVTSSLEARIKMLEEEMKRANEDMEVSREYVSQIQAQISPDPPVDCGIQTSIQGVREISDLESKRKKITAIEDLLSELGFDNMHDFEKAVHEWRTKAKLFDQVQSFVDRVDDVIWETPFVSLLSVCQQHKNLISRMRDSAEDICETHRTQYEKALLEAERDKTRAHSSMPYSSEHLDVTFERLVRWAHMVRHVTS